MIFCGINPGLRSAAVGHHFAHPSNRFWRVLHRAGFTPHLLDPNHDASLPVYGLGLTNLVDRPSASANELSALELSQGRARLLEKIGQFNPKMLAFLGLGAYRKAFHRPKSKIGLQAECIGQTQMWLLPNPSGLNAHYSIKNLTDLFRQLRQTVLERS